MNVLIIRHAEAVDPGAFAGNDLQRPLTPRGTRRTRTMFRRLRERLPKPDVIISSQAARARATAEAAAGALGVKKVRVDEALNPGASWAAIRRVLRQEGAAAETVALVGHDPDLSAALAAWTGAAGIEMKKGAVAWLETDAQLRRPRLRALVPPALIA
jgi:phosphohistidine phosphatase